MKESVCFVHRHINSYIGTREVRVAPGSYLAGRAGLANSAADLSAETKQPDCWRGVSRPNTTTIRWLIVRQGHWSVCVPVRISVTKCLISRC